MEVPVLCFLVVSWVPDELYVNVLAWDFGTMQKIEIGPSRVCVP